MRSGDDEILRSNSSVRIEFDDLHKDSGDMPSLMTLIEKESFLIENVLSNLVKSEIMKQRSLGENIDNNNKYHVLI